MGTGHWRIFNLTNSNPRSFQFLSCSISECDTHLLGGFLNPLFSYLSVNLITKWRNILSAICRSKLFRSLPETQKNCSFWENEFQERVLGDDFA
jgi:hypothetical protein